MTTFGPPGLGSTRTEKLNVGLDVPTNGRFRLEIHRPTADDEKKALVVGSFLECSGLSVEVDMVEIKEGGQNEYVHRRPGRVKWPNLTFKRGVTDTNGLFTWLNEASGRTAQSGVKVGAMRANGSVFLLDSMGTELRRWDFADAIPVKWKGPDFNLAGSDIATEELEVAHHGFTVEDGEWK